jgi:hypothetical protein
MFEIRRATASRSGSVRRHEPTGPETRRCRRVANLRARHDRPAGGKAPPLHRYPGKALENSQPGAHPPPHMPVPRWWWVCDATPGSRASALSATQSSEPALPGSDEPVSFEQHVQPLFREVDRKSMRFAFDLWSHEDVAGNADAILERLQAGTMPCDGAWPSEKVAVFERWIESGKPS